MFGQAARPPCTALGLEPVHEIHNIEEAAASAVADEVIEQFAGVLYRWNTGQVQMRWDIDPAALGGMFSIRWEGLAGHA